MIETVAPEHNHNEAGDGPSVEEFVQWVQGILAKIETTDAGKSWCPQWWDHPEAVERLEGLFIARLIAIKEDALSSWWTDHWDRHARALFGQDGVFQKCAVGEHVPHVPRLIAESPPVDWVP